MTKQLIKFAGTQQNENIYTVQSDSTYSVMFTWSRGTVG